MKSYISDSLSTQLFCAGAADNPEVANYDRPVIVRFEVASAEWHIVHAELINGATMLFGLCDLGLGFPELGYLPASELDQFSGVITDTECDLTLGEAMSSKGITWHIKESA